MIARQHPDGSPAVLANAHAAGGLSKVALGRVLEALAHLDSVAAHLDTPAAWLHAKQWRTVPAALGAPSIRANEAAAARLILRRLARQSDVATRAAWTLALDAYASDNATAARNWVAQVAADTSHEAQRLVQHLEAVRLARLGAYGRALDVSASLVPLTAKDSRFEPFLRTAVYLSRAQWRMQLNDPGVDGAWLWYENADIEGWPTGLPQSGEIDWAFSTFARFHRGKAALERGDDDLGCSLLSRVLELWVDADPAYQPLVTEATQLTEDARCPA